MGRCKEQQEMPLGGEKLTNSSGQKITFIDRGRRKNVIHKQRLCHKCITFIPALVSLLSFREGERTTLYELGSIRLPYVDWGCFGRLPDRSS